MRRPALSEVLHTYEDFVQGVIHTRGSFLNSQCLDWFAIGKSMQHSIQRSVKLPAHFSNAGPAVCLVSSSNNFFAAVSTFKPKDIPIPVVSHVHVGWAPNKAMNLPACIITSSSLGHTHSFVASPRRYQPGTYGQMNTGHAVESKNWALLFLNVHYKFTRCDVSSLWIGFRQVFPPPCFRHAQCRGGSLASWRRIERQTLGAFNCRQVKPSCSSWWHQANNVRSNTLWRSSRLLHSKATRSLLAASSVMIKAQSNRASATTLKHVTCY